MKTQNPILKISVNENGRETFIRPSLEEYNGEQVPLPKFRDSWLCAGLEIVGGAVVGLAFCFMLLLVLGLATGVIK